MTATESWDTTDLAGLGVATRADLDAIVARCLEVSAARVRHYAVTESPYDLEALTTLSRQRVHGVATTPAGDRPFSIFVKVLRSWVHHPAFAQVPPEFRALAATGLPWAVEPRVYRTGLRAALPTGLTMPRTYVVCDLDATHGAVWIEDIATVDRPWDPDTTATAARGLGRFAASREVSDALRPLAADLRERDVRSYAEGRVAAQIVPMLRSDVWAHPAIARHFGGQRERVLATLDRLPMLVAEVEALPHGTSHGDACPRNLLHRAGSGELVLIDFGFVSRTPLGFDLNQLTLGQAQLGERPAADVPALRSGALRGYLAGLADEGVDADRADVERATSVCGWIFTGLSALPFEQLAADPAPGGALDRRCAERAKIQRDLLDELERTERLRRRPEPAPATAAS